MEKQVKFDKVQVYIYGGEDTAVYFEDNEYKLKDESEIARLFGLEPFHFANVLVNENTCELNAFNTYNWGAPIVLDGVYCEDMNFALVNIHRGGDARGNYSAPYICETSMDVDAILSQNTELYIALSDGTEYHLHCDNGEAYFPFDTFDPYHVDFDEPLTKEQIAELNEKCKVYRP